MPHIMSHLYIAKETLDGIKSRINDIPQYFLGTLSPDAIEYKEDSSIVHKRISHLYEGLEKENHNILGWIKNVENFYFEHKSDEINDFLLGFCIHIMADIYNYEFIQTPFRSKFGEEDEKIYKIENRIIDYEIFYRENLKTNIFPYIEKSRGIDFFNIISINELNKLKNDSMKIEFAIEQITTICENKYITYNKMKESNDNMVKYIKKEFLDKIN